MTVVVVLIVSLGPACTRTAPNNEEAGTNHRGAARSHSTDGAASGATGALGPNRPAPPQIEPTIRVRFSVTSMLKEEVVFTFGSEGQELIVLERGGQSPFMMAAPITLTARAGGWSLSEHDHASMREVTPLCSLAIRTCIGQEDTIVFGDEVLPGAIDLVPHEERDTIDLVVALPMERYLPGVLDGELFAGWPVATFEAQAVAARSYAVAERAFWLSRRHFDVVAGPASQAWSGLDNSERARDAVAATQGVLLVHEGGVVPAYYSACCGGLSASATDSISDRVGHRVEPLNARPNDIAPCCEDAPLRNWSAKFSLRAVREGVRLWGAQQDKGASALEGFGRLRAIEVVNRNAAGRPVMFALVDRKGKQVEVSSIVLRRILGAIPRVGGAPAQPLYSDAFDCRVSGDQLIVDGHGYGHGVGLCQYGAKTMGAQGQTWEEIVRRYYPDARLEQSWPVDVSMDVSSDA